MLLEDKKSIYYIEDIVSPDSKFSYVLGVTEKNTDRKEINKLLKTYNEVYHHRRNISMFLEIPVDVLNEIFFSYKNDKYKYTDTFICKKQRDILILHLNEDIELVIIPTSEYLYNSHLYKPYSLPKNVDIMIPLFVCRFLNFFIRHRVLDYKVTSHITIRTSSLNISLSSSIKKFYHGKTLINKFGMIFSDGTVNISDCKPENLYLDVM